MTKKIRVHELAKDLGLASRGLIDLLSKEGIKATSHMSVVDDDIAELLRDQYKEGAAAESELEKTPTNDGKQKPSPQEIGSKSQEPEQKSEGANEGSGDEQKAKSQPASTSLPSGEELETEPDRQLNLKPPIIVKHLASVLKVKPNELIHNLLKMNVFASINQTLDIGIAEKICTQYGYHLVADKREKQSLSQSSQVEVVSPEDVVYDDEEISLRPPIVAFLGHVDHGKTSLLDKVRKTNVTAKEAGGITQHIGATTIEWKGHVITFIDTPGHEAFTAMRARGANTTDIVVLVVAADDGVMPQTVEAINHAKAANVPIVVALNKMDLPAADSVKVMSQLQQNGLTLEEWGGEVGVVEVSAHTGEGIDNLLERLLLESEILELKANPKLPVKAIVLESQLEQGLGTTVNLLVKNGMIHVGDIVICGQHYGKIKALINNQGKKVKEAGPSYAAKAVGLSGLPEGGTILVGCKDEKQAKKLTEDREFKAREEQLKPQRQTNLNDLFQKIESNSIKELKIIVKTDAQGTGEAVVEILEKLVSDKIKIDIIHVAVGAITENDVLLGAASNAIIVGFHVRVNPGVNPLAQKEGVKIRLYSVIYELADEIKAEMIDLLDPELREEQLGKSEILQIFVPSKGPKICGCSVTKGLVRVGAKARVYRGDELLYSGLIQSLRRFNDDVKVVRQGFECGIRLDHFNDFEVGDRIDIFEFKEVAPSL